MKIFKIMSVGLLIYNGSHQAADIRGPQYDTATQAVEGISSNVTILSDSTERLGPEELEKLKASYQLLGKILKDNKGTTTIAKLSRQASKLIHRKKG
jgi:hypothetical protein